MKNLVLCVWVCLCSCTAQFYTTAMILAPETVATVGTHKKIDRIENYPVAKKWVEINFKTKIK